MITIKEAIFKRSYKYLWLKHVTKVNLMLHCAKCLIGKYDERVFAYMRKATYITLEGAPYYYLCGVASTGIWAQNLHLAFREKEGSTIILDNEYIKCRIENAEQIEITDAFIDETHPYASKKAYNTCRNWWFAMYLASTRPTIDVSGSYKQHLIL